MIAGSVVGYRLVNCDITGFGATKVRRSNTDVLVTERAGDRRGTNSCRGDRAAAVINGDVQRVDEPGAGYAVITAGVDSEVIKTSYDIAGGLDKAARATRAAAPGYQTGALNV